MMKLAVALLALLALAACHVQAQSDQTWVNNQSQWTIVVTIGYSFAGTSQFNNRQIAPGHQDHDEYGDSNCQYGGYEVYVHAAIDGQTTDTVATVGCDRSVVFVDGQSGHGDVDIYLSVRGNTSQKEGEVIINIPVPT